MNGLVRVHFKQCDSTQTRAKSYLSKIRPREGLVVSADYQSGGRGQLGSHWLSSEGLNLTLSMLFTPQDLDIDKRFLFNIWISQALVNLLHKKLGEQKIRVKWPNDILVNGKKIAGILIQNNLRGDKLQYVIVGIGINVNEVMKTYSFPATSMRSEAGRSYNLNELKEELIGQVWKTYIKGLQFPEMQLFKSAYEKLLWKMDQKVSIIEGGVKKTCRIKGINKIGELKVKIDGDIRLIRNKDVTFILNED